MAILTGALVAPGPSLTWKVKDTWGVHPKPIDVRLRVNMVNPPGEVIVADGDPPQNKPGVPRRLTYLLQSHQGDSTTFVNVIEPYSGERVIKNIERTDRGDTVTLRITLASGRVDYITSSNSLQPIPSAGSAKARFAAVTEENGKRQTKLLVE